MEIQRYVAVETPVPENTKHERLRTVESMAMDDFLHSNADVLIFTYDTAKEAYRRYTSVWKLVNQSERFATLHTSLNENKIYVIKK